MGRLRYSSPRICQLPRSYFKHLGWVLISVKTRDLIKPPCWKSCLDFLEKPVSAGFSSKDPLCHKETFVFLRVYFGSKITDISVTLKSCVSWHAIQLPETSKFNVQLRCPKAGLQPNFGTPSWTTNARLPYRVAVWSLHNIAIPFSPTSSWRVSTRFQGRDCELRQHISVATVPVALVPSFTFRLMYRKLSATALTGVCCDREGADARLPRSPTRNLKATPLKIFVSPRHRREKRKEVKSATSRRGLGHMSYSHTK